MSLQPSSLPEPTEFKFEAALDKLQLLVKKLESGELSLEDSLKTYEEGIRLTQQSHQYLKAAEQKIEVLNQSLVQASI